MMTSHPATILLVYLLCYMQFGSYIHTVGKIVTGLDATSRMSHISNIYYYHKGLWNNIERKFKPLRIAFHNREPDILVV